MLKAGVFLNKEVGESIQRVATFRIKLKKNSV